MITITLTNGVTYDIPENGDTDWSDVTKYLVDLRDAILQGSRVVTPQVIIPPVEITLATDSTLTPGSRSAYLVEGTTGPVTLNQLTPVAPGTQNGAILYLYGLSDTNTVTIPDNGGTCQINGPCTLHRFEMIELVWISQFNKWVEVSRNN